MDAIFFHGSSDAVFYLDDVSYNNDGTLTPPIAGDLNGDGFVGIADLNLVLGAWNQAVPPGDPLADPSGDGFVGIADLNTVLGSWNSGTPPGTVVPEPGAVVLLATGAVSIATQRRKVRG